MSLPVGPARGAGAAGRSAPERASRGRPAPSRRAHRRGTQIRRNALVLAWLVSAAALTALSLIGPLGALGTWLPLHALLLGGIGSAITIWSAHFADTLLHRPALGGAGLLDARLCAHTLGTIAVLVGLSAGHRVLAMSGVALIMCQALAGMVAIGVQYRRAVAARMGALALHYALALVLLAVGAALGYLISWSDDAGRARLAETLYLAHTTTMLLGFVGITVLGTLTVLWPTMLRTRMEPFAARWAVRTLPLLVAGTAITASSGLWQPLAGLGTGIYIVGACGVLVPGILTARRVPPTSFATASAGAAVLWLLGCLGYLGAGITLADGAAAGREVIHTARLPLGAGFALQILVAALSYLAPVMLGGGPAMTRTTNAIMDRWAAYRVTAANACLLVSVSPAPPWTVRLVCGAVAGAVTSYLLVGIVLCLRAVARGAGDRRSAAADDPSRRPVPAAAPRARDRGQPTGPPSGPPGRPLNAPPNESRP
ncbi:hypothetical protein [Actinomyces bowdenii]|uniref:hypothetical protein n=1 Tax=Actinomyces bowdenii TaxID=131109 RepID=UPI0016398AE2|nr:hypothetical protein [Actinomyces bowdenii]